MFADYGADCGGAGDNMRARVALPIAVSGDVLDTQIDARNRGRTAPPPGSRKSPGLVAPHDERRHDATGECQERHPDGIAANGRKCGRLDLSRL